MKSEKVTKEKTKMESKPRARGRRDGGCHLVTLQEEMADCLPFLPFSSSQHQLPQPSFPRQSHFHPFNHLVLHDPTW